jgi:hypothetical protein
MKKEIGKKEKKKGERRKKRREKEGKKEGGKKEKKKGERRKKRKKGKKKERNERTKEKRKSKAEATYMDDALGVQVSHALGHVLGKIDAAQPDPRTRVTWILPNNSPHHSPSSHPPFPPPPGAVAESYHGKTVARSLTSCSKLPPGMNSVTR